ncbi:hypothetical protein QQS21_000313 [Conoideocrella luteorostrata]|uniref:gamma-glutamylcyclotransferase n=1 Tax=Conoideocrella luteorostrata TaxID=1105319 RepID=A0AAJ0G2U0_9HYPO|nr:hypothetical protein QQS21_000313 [Conoideocrella luteorostrata]
MSEKSETVEGVNMLIADTVWYFAYGSNMRSFIMVNRGIKPLEQALVKIPTYVLTFKIFGMPYSEPSMASIANMSHVDVNTVLRRGSPAPLPPIHGIAYLITRADYVTLVKSEDGGSACRDIALEADVFRHAEPDSGTMGPKLTVFTLEAKYPFRPNATPSQRYIVSVY